MGEQNGSAPLGMQVRLSKKVIRRDGTVEDMPGEWYDANFEQVENLKGNPSFRAWFKEEWRKAKADAEAKADKKTHTKKTKGDG